MAKRSFRMLRGGRESNPLSGGSKHILSAGRTSVYKAPSHDHVSPFCATREKGTTYTNTNQDHLDIAEHLRDADDDVEHNGHKLREAASGKKI